MSLHVREGLAAFCALASGNALLQSLVAQRHAWQIELVGDNAKSGRLPAGPALSFLVDASPAPGHNPTASCHNPTASCHIPTAPGHIPTASCHIPTAPGHIPAAPVVV